MSTQDHRRLFPSFSHSKPRPKHDRKHQGSRKINDQLAPVSPRLPGSKHFDARRGDFPAESCDVSQGGVEVAVSISARKLAARMWKLAAESPRPIGFEDQYSRGSPKLRDNMRNATILNKSSSRFKDDGVNPVISVLQAKLKKARARINELETQRRMSMKEINRFKKELGEERNHWMRREHEKSLSLIHDLKLMVKKERENRRRVGIVNSKLLRDLGDAEFSAIEFMRGYERERKSRALMEDVCEEFLRKIEEDKEVIEELERECTRIRKEVEEERKMMQVVEVWREERLQMKLVDAKVILEEKYRQMNNLVTDLEAFLASRDDETLGMIEMSEADIIRQAVNSVNFRDIKEFTFMPREPDTIEDPRNEKDNRTLEITKSPRQNLSINGFGDQGWSGDYGHDDKCTSIDVGSSCTELSFFDGVAEESLKSEISDICSRLEKRLGIY